MTQLQIRKQIDANNEAIAKALNPSQFILNNIVADLLEENTKLRKHCKHEFDEDGFCIWCDMMEEIHDN